MKRCPWKNLEKDEVYIKYHDEEWGQISKDDKYLFEMLVLESFHCGLSWLIVLKKRKYFKEAYDDFDYYKVSKYEQTKIDELLGNKNIIRSKGKILASISNAKAFIKVIEEYGSFYEYIWSFTNNKVVSISNLLTHNELSDKISKDLKKRGFKYMGTVTTYSYLEAIGVMNNHVQECFLCK